MPTTEDTHPKMSNVNMSDDPRKERELNAITADDEYEDATGSDVENVLGSVHISKPSIKHVFFLLRPILKPILEQFNRQEHELHELVNMMKLERTFIDKPVSISANVAYEVNYYDRKFLFIWSPIALSLTADDGSTIPVQASTWVQISLRRGMHLRAPAITDAQPIGVLIRATDTLMSSDSVSAVLFGTQTTIGDFPIGVDANGRLKIGVAPANAGTIIGQVVLATGANNVGNVGFLSDYPNGAIPITASSGNVANAIATATLAANATKTTYITGFEISGAGATGALVVTVTVTGTITGTLSYTYIFVAGVTTANQPLIVEFTHPIPASAVNTTIAVSCPASGAGGTNNTVVAHGYQL